MEPQYVAPDTGIEVQIEDIDTWSANAGLADDRVLWELLRLTHGSATPQKAILPYGESGGAEYAAGINSTALVHSTSTGNGSIRVMPFRAIIGSTTLAASDTKESMRGIRSGLYVNASTVPYGTFALVANSSGNPRWDLVYASVTPNVDSSAVDRYIKEPTTEVVSVNTSAVTKVTTVAVTVATGTPGASPARPALPADGAGTYYIALAYIWVENGFTTVTTVDRRRIHEVAPCITLASQLGAMSVEPANQQYTVGGVVDVAQSGATSAVRPGAYFPPTAVGGVSRVILIQAGLNPESHVDGDVVDNSVDWRFRYTKWMVTAKTGATTGDAFASDRALTGTNPCPLSVSTPVVAHSFGMGHTFLDATGSGYGYGYGMFADGDNITGLGAEMGLYADATTGALKLYLGAIGEWQIIIWLDATGPYSNFGQV